MITPAQALSNIVILHRKVKMLPDEHEAIQESIAVLNDLVSPAETNRKFNITSQVAFDNIVAVYNRAQLSVEEFEAIKESLIVVSKLVKKTDVNAPKSESSGKSKN